MSKKKVRVKKTTRKQRCGTDNVDRAMSWSLAIQKLLEAHNTWRGADTPTLALELDDRRKAGGLTTPLFSWEVRLFIEDFLRTYPKPPTSSADLKEIRIRLVTEFDIPMAFRELREEPE